MNGNGNGNWVKWVLGFIIIGLLTFMGYVAQAHVTRSEFDIVREQINRIEAKVDRLLEQR